MARVLFFGRLRDVARGGERTVDLDRTIDLAAFRRLVAADDQSLEAELAAPHIRIALNSTLLPRDASCTVAPGDEVAFMAPFSGG